MAIADFQETLQRPADPQPGLEQLGMLADGLGLGDGDPLMIGANTAIKGFVRAIFQHRRVGACDIFAPSSMLEAVRREVVRLSGAFGHRAGAVVPLEQIANRIGRNWPGVMHNPTGELAALHYLRSHVAPGTYPITVGHHTMSPAFWRCQMILPVLLAGYRPSDAIVCSSSPAREAIAALLRQVQEAFDAEYSLKLPFRGRLEVIPLGVDTQALKPGNREEARARLELPLNKLILLSLGRFSERNKMDLEPLLEVFRQLRHACRREILLIVAGSDLEGYSVRVRELAEELGLQPDVLVLTNLPGALPALLYAAADVFVSVSDSVQEMFGQANVEAMAAGLPVVVSDWDGHRETVVHGETGFRVPTVWARCDADLCGLSPLCPTLQDHALLAQSVAVDCGKLFQFLKLLLDADALRERMGEAARRRAVAEYSWSTVLGRYEALWAELADQAQSLPEHAEQQLGFLRPDYTGAFGHFATRLLTPEARLRLTKLGDQAVRGRAPLRIHSSLGLYFNTASLRQILALLLVAERLKRRFQVRTALKVLCGRHALSEPAALRHLLWLLKHGLVSLVDD